MRYIVIAFFILSVSSFFGCRPEPLRIELEPFENQVVVFSQIIPGEFMTVLLTKTISALDFSEEEGDTVNQDFLNDLLETEATVTVSYRDVVDTLFEIPANNGMGTGVYASIQTPQYINEEYELKVVTKDGQNLSAKSIMLPLVEFDEVLPNIELTTDDTLVTVDFKIIDLPEDNWYMLNFYTNGDDNQQGVDLNSFFNSGSNLLKKTELISDITFEGNIYEGTVELPNVSPTDSLVVTISNINETYYKFLEARKTSSNFFTEITKEPISAPTNIVGGLGFFNTHFPDLEFFDLNDF